MSGAPRLVQFGAGNIGRSFIAQLFSASGYDVVFIDVDRDLVDAINRKGEYNVVIRDEGVADRSIRVERVRAVNARDADAVAREIAAATIIATSVGSGALESVLPVIAKGVELRGDPPVDVIIAENIRDGAKLFRTGLEKHLPRDYPLDARVGFVETSIGKMVPLMSAADRASDPLRVFAEPYNTLIVARSGFLNGVPDVEGLRPVDEIAAFVDRKLFIHNLGHAACAYHSYVRDPARALIADAIASPEVYGATRAAMDEMAAVLAHAYPNAYTATELAAHVEDLLARFANRALGDTVYRVGRDLPRKLGHDDRITGAMLLAERCGLPYDAVVNTFYDAIRFAAGDEGGNPFPRDREFHARYPVPPEGTIPESAVRKILNEVCGLAAAGDTRPAREPGALSAGAPRREGAVVERVLAVRRERWYPL